MRIEIMLSCTNALIARQNRHSFPMTHGRGKSKLVFFPHIFLLIDFTKIYRKERLVSRVIPAKHYGLMLDLT